jgi:hypothetical protein
MIGLSNLKALIFGFLIKVCTSSTSHRKKILTVLDIESLFSNPGWIPHQNTITPSSPEFTPYQTTGVTCADSETAQRNATTLTPRLSPIACNPTDIVAFPASSVTQHDKASDHQRPAETSRPPVSEHTGSIMLNTFSISPEQPLNDVQHTEAVKDQTKKARNNKHSTQEKYFCYHSDCKHSQSGSGFKRKDHLDQHLRGPHKQASVPRVRAPPDTVASTSRGPITETVMRATKRKRGEEEGFKVRNVDEMWELLAEERQLRLHAEKQRDELRQRLDKAEERIDMLIFGQSGKGEGKRKE